MSRLLGHLKAGARTHKQDSGPLPHYLAEDTVFRAIGWRSYAFAC